MPRRAVRVPPGGFRRIAVLRLSSLGDVILALPVVHALKRAFPGARLEFWTKEEYREALATGPATPAVRHNLAIALVKAGRPEEAAVELEGGHAPSGTPENVEIRGEGRANHGKTGLAAEPLGKARLGEKRSREPVGHRVH